MKDRYFYGLTLRATERTLQNSKIFENNGKLQKVADAGNNEI
jgi:hypothetical protein